MGAQGVGQLA